MVGVAGMGSDPGLYADHVESRTGVQDLVISKVYVANFRARVCLIALGRALDQYCFAGLPISVVVFKNVPGGHHIAAAFQFPKILDRISEALAVRPDPLRILP